MPCDIGSGPDERIIADLSDLYNIIADKSVSSLNEFKRRLGFTDPALTRDENSFAVYIDENTVNGNARSQLDIKPSDDLRHKV